MNVWKYIYIKFYKYRRKIIGFDGADDYAAMLFVTSINLLFFFGIFNFIDAALNNLITDTSIYLVAFFIVGGALLAEFIHNRLLCKNGAFERIKKEVEEEPRKLYWGILSILYIVLAFGFAFISTYLWAKKMIPPLI